MKIVYINILKSILICNVFCCFIAAVWLWGGRNDFFERYLIALLYSYIMFGITGSILWCSFYLFVSKFIGKKEVCHIVACGLASVLSGPIFYLLIGEVNGAKNSLDYLIFIIPTAAVCLAFYIFRYLKREKFNTRLQSKLRPPAVESGGNSKK